MHSSTVKVVTDGPVVRIGPELDERMRVRGFGSSSVLSRKEQETQQRHAPKEAGPNGNAGITPSASHGSSSCFLTGTYLHTGLSAWRPVRLADLSFSQPPKGTTGV